MKRFLDFLAGAVVSKPWLFILLALILSIGAVPGVFKLQTDSGFDTMVSPQSAVFKDNAKYEDEFGGETIVVRLNGKLEEVLSPDNLTALAQFEQAYSNDGRFLYILSPVTVINIAGAQFNASKQMLLDELARAQELAAAEARKAAAAMGLGAQEQELAARQAEAKVLEQFQPQLAQIEAVGTPGLDNPLFVASVIYSADGSISSQMSSIIPDASNVLIFITPAGNLSDSVMMQAIGDIESYFSAHPLDNTLTTVISASKLMDAIAASITGSLKLLLVLALGAMVLVLYMTFRVRWRLLSLLLVGIGSLWAFGFMGYIGIPVSMATMAVLPILIGLGIDYSIQFHNRYQELIRDSRSVGEAVKACFKSMAPVVALALLTTLLSFLTLLINKIPMIRDFGLVLSIGIIMCYLVALFLLHSIVNLGDRRTPVARLGQHSVEAGGRIEKILAWMTRTSLRIPLTIFIISLAMAVAGFFADSRLEVTTDFQEFIPQDIPALKEVRELAAITGSDGMITFMLQAPDVTSPELLNWLKSFQEDKLAQHPDLSAVSSVLSLIAQGSGSTEIPDRDTIDSILANMPAVYTLRYISADRSAASVSFSLKYESFQQVIDLIKSVQAEADLPAGASLSPVGTYALAAELFETLTGTRFWMNMLCLGAITLVLLLAYRRLTVAILVVITAGLVLLWSSADMFILGIPLNPLTQVLGVIVIGSVTEYMVLILNRYREEKALGEPPKEAMITAVSRIGRAIVASAATTLAGFAVLIASDFVMLRDFGIATVIGIVLCIISTMMVMPPLIVWLDERSEKLKQKLGKG